MMEPTILVIGNIDRDLYRTFVLEPQLQGALPRVARLNVQDFLGLDLDNDPRMEAAIADIDTHEPGCLTRFYAAAADLLLEHFAICRDDIVALLIDTESERQLQMSSDWLYASGSHRGYELLFPNLEIYYLQHGHVLEYM